MLKNSLDDSKRLFRSISKKRKIAVGAKALYFYLVNMESSEFPSRKKLAYDLNISNLTLGKYLKQLIKNGYIKCEQHKENGRFGNNFYTIQSGG